MTDYDALAAAYDGHFRRPVDRWEDQRLTALLTPHLTPHRGARTRVLDLGCGTGWLLDHLPWVREYTGVDSSPAMLNRLMTKHPHATVVKTTVNTPGWQRELECAAPFQVVTATWSAHDLGALPALLVDLRRLVWPGSWVLLHGQAPRYRHRDHYIAADVDHARNYLRFTPGACVRAADVAGLEWHGASGTGATPDRLPYRPLWQAGTRLTPARWHWAFLARWRVP